MIKMQIMQTPSIIATERIQNSLPKFNSPLSSMQPPWKLTFTRVVIICVDNCYFLRLIILNKIDLITHEIMSDKSNDILYDIIYLFIVVKKYGQSKLS